MDVVLIFEYRDNGWNIHINNHREVEECAVTVKPIFNKNVIFSLEALVSQ